MFFFRNPILFTLMLLPALFEYASSGNVPFTPTGIASLKGKNVCDLQGEFYSGVGVYLGMKKEHSLHYRERDGVIALFLLSKPSLPNCGIVDATLDLTQLTRPGEKPEFKCYTDREGGTTWEKWGQIVGLANNDRGQKRFVRARLAWRVDVAKKQFEAMKGKTVRCDTSGYKD